MDSKNKINLTGFQFAKIEQADCTSDPSVEMFFSRKGRGYFGKGSVVKISVPLNELMKSINTVKKIVLRYHYNTTAMVKNLEDTLRTYDK